MTQIFFLKKNISLKKLFPKEKFKRDFKISDIKSLDFAGKNDIFFDKIDYKNMASQTKASVCITTHNLEKYLPKSVDRILVNNVLVELARVTKHLYPFSDIDYPDSSLKKPSKSKYKKVIFGNNVLIGKDVKIGEYSIIGSNTIVEQNVIIGKNCVIGSGIVIKNSILGNNIVIQDGCKIGQKGFGFIPINGKI